MNKKEKLRKILESLESTEDKVFLGISNFEEEIANLTKRIRKDVTVKSLDSINTEIRRLKNDISFAPILQSLNDLKKIIATSLNSTTNILEDNFSSISYNVANIENRMGSLSSRINEFKDTKSEEKLSKLDSALTSLVEEVDKIKSNTSKYIKEKEKQTEERIHEIREELNKSLESGHEEINKLKVNILSNNRGGSIPLQVSAGGTVANTRYAEINFIGATAVTNNTTKKTDITTPGGGTGFTKAIMSGTIDDSNMVFTSNGAAPTYLIINGTWYDNTAGAPYTWTGTTTVTLNNPVGTGGQIFGFY